MPIIFHISKTIPQSATLFLLDFPKNMQTRHRVAVFPCTSKKICLQRGNVEISTGAEFRQAVDGTTTGKFSTWLPF